MRSCGILLFVAPLRAQTINSISVSALSDVSLIGEPTTVWTHQVRGEHTRSA
jgi:hypothetical protein